MTPDPAPDLTPKALDALQQLIKHNRDWNDLQDVDRDAYDQADAAITALRARLAEAEAARDQAPTGAPLTMEAIRLVAAEGDLTPQAVLGAANFWIGRMMDGAVRRALESAADRAAALDRSEANIGRDSWACGTIDAANSILALANNPEAIKRIVEGRDNG